VVRCAKQQQQVRRQRADCPHKSALRLLRTGDTISIEAIQPANLRRRPASKQDEHGQIGT